MYAAVGEKVGSTISSGSGLGHVYTNDWIVVSFPVLPVQHRNVRVSNRQGLNVILYVDEHGCKGRGVPPWFGHWHPIYTRMNRWAKTRGLDRVFEHIRKQRLVRIKLEAVSLDRTIVQVHPDGRRGREKKQAAGSWQVSRRMAHQASSGCR